LLFHLRFLRRAIPVKGALARSKSYPRRSVLYDRGISEGDEAGGPVSDNQDKSIQEAVDEEIQEFFSDSHPVSTVVRPVTSAERILLPTLLMLMITITLVSIFAFDHGMAISQTIATLLFYYSVRSRSSDEDNKQTSVTDPILRAYFVTVTLVVIMDSATAGSWLGMHVFITSEPRVIFYGNLISLWIGFRTLINFLGLLLAASILVRL